MKDAKVTVTVKQGLIPSDKYRIQKITNSVLYRVGDYVKKEDVQAMIDDNWTVHVTDKSNHK